MEATSSPRFAKPFLAFLGTVAALIVLRVIAGTVEVPTAILPVVNVLLAVAFLAIPILGISLAARAPWRPAHAFALVAFGVAVQGLAIYISLHTGGTVRLLAQALNQGALQLWCVGLGAVVATLIRERNILIPITIFLAVFDLFLVLTPIGFTQQALQKAPAVLANVGHAVPQARPQERPGVPPPPRAEVIAYIGPADLVFLGAYFIALARFGMRLKDTVRWMVPVLALYLAFVLATSIALPALVPIGIVTLWANRREFRLTKDEWASTGVVVALGLGLLAWGATRPRASRVEPSNPPSGRVRPASPTTPAPVDAGRSPSSAPAAR